MSDPETEVTEKDRAQGCLVGLACGDALGRPVEFHSPHQIESKHGQVTEMLGDGTHGKPAGTITDDTELALCIAESLVDRDGFDPTDVADRFADWLSGGPFDVGLMTRDSISRYRNGLPWNRAGVDVWQDRPEGSNAGNGSVMRCAPYALAFRNVEEELVHVSRMSSTLTHADPRCQWGCALLNLTLGNLLRDVQDPLDRALGTAGDLPADLEDAISPVHGVLTGYRDPEAVENSLETTGYVVDSLQAALYFGLTADTLEEAIMAAVNSGGDTDTVGAMTGAVAGARFGVDAVPERWRAEVDEVACLESLADGLLEIRSAEPGREFEALDGGLLRFPGVTR
jgi:ADP-ribosyl-[dinitrogen reductase] hydrolase